MINDRENHADESSPPLAHAVGTVLLFAALAAGVIGFAFATGKTGNARPPGAISPGPGLSDFPYNG